MSLEVTMSPWQVGLVVSFGSEIDLGSDERLFIGKFRTLRITS